MSAKGIFVSDTGQQITASGGTWDTTINGQGLVRNINIDIREDSSGSFAIQDWFNDIDFAIYVDGEGSPSTDVPLLHLFGVSCDNYIGLSISDYDNQFTSDQPKVPGIMAEEWTDDDAKDHWTFYRECRLPFDTSIKLEIENNAGGVDHLRLVHFVAEVALF